MREVDGDFRIPVRRDEMAEHQRKVGDRQPRARMPHRRAKQNLRVDQRRRRRREHARAAVRESRRVRRRVIAAAGRVPYPAIQPGDVNSAIDTTRQKKISARPAWAVEMAAGRKKRTVSPPRTPWATTAPRAATPSHFSQRRGSAPTAMPRARS